jgi:hypothetical protein
MSISLDWRNSGWCKIQGPFSDHLEIMKPEDIEALKKCGDNACCIAFLLLFFGIPYTPAREMIAAGLH